MDSFIVYSYRSTWLLWVLLVPFFGAYTMPVNVSCRHPQIGAPRTPLSLYQLHSTVSVTVYHCFYYEENICNQQVCSNCSGYTTEPPVYGRLIHQYSDVTQNCLDATASGHFIDKYGSDHKIDYSVTIEFPCNGGARLSKTTKVTITKFEAQADTQQDNLVLRSGTTCRYSAGVCYDRREGIDVVWEVKKPTISCKNYRKINTVDSYYLHLHEVSYVIVKFRYKYLALEVLKRSVFCGVPMSETSGIFAVSEELAPQATNEPIDLVDDTEFYFDNKEDLYDFLIDTCTFRHLNTDPRILSNPFFSSLPLDVQKQKMYAKRMSVEIERLRAKSEIYFYVVISVVVCFVFVLGCIVYFTHKKRSSVTNCVPDSTVSVQDTANVYEYVTSEYDINSEYSNKLIQ